MPFVVKDLQTHSVVFPSEDDCPLKPSQFLQRSNSLPLGGISQMATSSSQETGELSSDNTLSDNIEISHQSHSEHSDAYSTSSTHSQNISAITGHASVDSLSRSVESLAAQDSAVSHRVAAAFGKDKIVQQIVTELAGETNDPVEMGRRERQFLMIRHSKTYKRKQVSLANSAWNDDLNQALNEVQSAFQTPEVNTELDKDKALPSLPSRFVSLVDHRPNVSPFPTPEPSSNVPRQSRRVSFSASVILISNPSTTGTAPQIEIVNEPVENIEASIPTPALAPILSPTHSPPDPQTIQFVTNQDQIEVLPSIPVLSETDTTASTWQQSVLKQELGEAAALKNSKRQTFWRPIKKFFSKIKKFFCRK